MIATATKACESGGYAPNFEGFGSIGDLFDAFFGGPAHSAGRSGRRPARTLAVAVEVDLSEAATGARVEVAYEAIERCEHCHGNGAEPGTPIETCERCGGSGQLQALTRTPFGQMMRRVVCEICHGDGRVAKQPVPGVSRARSQGRAAQSRGATCPPGSPTVSGSGSPSAGTPERPALPRATCTSS